MSKIELRLSNIDPPLPEPKRTIYRDIVNLPDPVKLGLTIRYFNHDDVGLYFQITGSAPGYTFETVNLGLLASGANAYRNLDEFASRAKPTKELEENITLTLKAYTDSSYTNLKWTYNRIVTVKFINSADPSYTVDVLNNFDDGTVQGWSGETGVGTPVQEVATDYVLSSPYSLSAGGNWPAGSQDSFCGAYKTFTTPDKAVIYAIFDVRFHPYGLPGPYGTGLSGVEILRDSTVLIKLGLYTWEAPDRSDYFPRLKWVRIVVPLPRNTTLTLRVRMHVRAYSNGYHRLRMDDFKIISK